MTLATCAARVPAGKRIGKGSPAIAGSAAVASILFVGIAESMLCNCVREIPKAFPADGGGGQSGEFGGMKRQA